MKIKSLVLPLLATISCYLLTTPMLTSCNNNGADVVTTETNLSVNSTSINLVYGETFKIIATFKNGEVSPVSFYSVNDRVAKVTPTGLITACGVGKTTITVSAANESINCNVEVIYGDSLPTLTIESIPEEGLVLSKGSSFNFAAQVVFNGVTYKPELEFSNYSRTTIGFNGVSMKALEVGETELDIKANWNDFDCPSLKKHISVKVVNTIELYAKVGVGDNTNITNEIKLSLVDKWPAEGSTSKSYNNKATIDVEAIDNNQVKIGSFEVADETIVKKNGKTITAVGCGETRITICYTSASGALYTSELYVEVTIPVIDYYLDNYINVKCDDLFPVDQIFGDGATILSASQNGVDLPIRRGKIIENIIPKGFETNPLTVITTHGGYVFNKVNAYTDILTDDNFNDIFQLESGKIVDGYYILNSDISVNTLSQTESKFAAGSSGNTYCSATIDGRGFDGAMHTIHATVGLQGMFGGFGNGATLKNIHFNFTFDTDNSGNTKTSCGLARNAGVYVRNAWVTTLENLYVTTTNYGPNTYSLMILRFDHLIMHDIYVKITGSENFEDFNDCYTQKWAALFQRDATFVQGPASQFYGGDFKNIYVVSNKFMPIANDVESETYLFVTYAHNDTDNLGNFKRFTETRTEINYCCITYKDANGSNANLFGHWRNSDNRFFERIAWMYANMGEDYKNEGINRYDSVNDVPVDVVGSWKVK